MTFAAAISFSSSVLPTRRFLAPINPSRTPFSFHVNTFGTKLPFRKQIFQASATSSMSIGAEEKASATSFLDKKESGILHFVKYHGLGNDFILVDNRDSLDPKITPEQAAKLCDRNFGIGADGVIFAMPGTNGTDYTMRIFNSDGSEPEMCGNGVRCFARFIAELENLHGKQSFTVHTGAGLIVPEIQDDGKVCVDMGEPILRAPDVPTKLPANKDQSVIKSGLDIDGTMWTVTCVSMGNPHCVTFGREDGQGLVVDELNLAEIGPRFEHHSVFPARTNTEFVQVFSRSHLKMRVWERGAGATLACGTGACATVVAAVLEGHSDRKCTVELPGGPLEIEWREADNHIYMTGVRDIPKHTQHSGKEESKRVHQELSYIQQVSSDAKEELHKYMEKVETYFLEDTFAAAEARTTMESCLQDCSITAELSKAKWENTYACINNQNKSSIAEMETVVKQNICASVALHEQFNSASSSIEGELDVQVTDISEDIKESLVLDQASKKEIDTMLNLCSDHLKPLQENHEDSISSIRGKADKSLRKDYQVDSSEMPRKRVIHIPTVASLEEMRTTAALKDHNTGNSNRGNGVKWEDHAESKLSVATGSPNRMPFGAVN